MLGSRHWVRAENAQSACGRLSRSQRVCRSRSESSPLKTGAYGCALRGMPAIRAHQRCWSSMNAVTSHAAFALACASGCSGLAAELPSLAHARMTTYTAWKRRRSPRVVPFAGTCGEVRDAGVFCQTALEYGCRNSWSRSTARSARTLWDSVVKGRSCDSSTRTVHRCCAFMPCGTID